MKVLDSFSLKGKVALLTGGAGLYGRQLAEALSEAGAITYIASRNLTELEKVAVELQGAGGDVTPLALDLASEASIGSVVKEIVTRSGRIDILVNNAVTRSACGGWDLSMDAFDQSLRINASSLFCLTRLVAEEMKKHHSGSIINIGSYMGLLGPDPQNYSGTDMMTNPSPIYFFEKGGMVNFTRFAASVLGEFGIRVNAIHPGGFFNHQPDAFVKNYCANTMLGRMANESDLKGILVFLASGASTYLTGTNIPVDGGYSLNNMNFSKITLGTVQFGMKYGIANTGGQPSLTEVCDILRHAYDHHINTLDTAAAYGSSEEVLGSALKQLGLTNRMQIISKVPPIQATTATEAEREIEATILTSLKRLQIEHLSACLLHRESDLPFLPILQKMVDRGLIGAAGVSLDSARYLDAASAASVIQLPCNILDRRFEAFWPVARSRGITIFARNVYLQGALLMPIANLPPHLRVIAPLRAKLAAIADAAAITLAELCMRFVLSNDAIGSVVTGVDTVAQLSENLRLAATGPLPASLLADITHATPLLPEAIVRPALWPTS